MKIITLVTVLVFLICSFTLKPAKNNIMPVQQQGSIHLDSTKWVLTELAGDSSFNTSNLKKPFIRFDSAKGSAYGNAACNNFGSSYLINGPDIKFSRIFSTKMYCQDLQDTETRFLQSLEKVNNYEIKDRQLFLYHDRRVELIFTAYDGSND